MGSRENKKRSKHHIKGYTQKRKKRNKQRFYSKVVAPMIRAKKEAYKETPEKLQKGLKKLEIQRKKTRKPQKKGKTK